MSCLRNDLEAGHDPSHPPAVSRALCNPGAPLMELMSSLLVPVWKARFMMIKLSSHSPPPPKEVVLASPGGRGGEERSGS